MVAVIFIQMSKAVQEIEYTLMAVAYLLKME
jgi:hypothetical protein